VSESTVVIPEAAVEAAARAMYAQDGGVGEFSLPVYEDYAKAMLEAASSHMFAGVTALADDWEKRGEYDMAYSKTVADEDIALQLLQAGAQMVDDARLVRNAIGGAE
jgi:hypothetical protein